MSAPETEQESLLTDLISIVFSCWKTTLNLLQLILENAKIHHVRIDGATPTIERNKIVKQFQEDPNTNLLLMTTGTGAVGYENSLSSPPSDMHAAN